MNPPLQDVRQPGSFAETLHRDPEAWAIRIRARWQMGVEAIISTGRLILEAKQALPHGAFGKMIAEQLPFKERQAQMLMAIASDARLSNPQYVALLPPSWGTIYDVTRLNDDEFSRAIDAGVIRPDMERADIERIRPRLVASTNSGGSWPVPPGDVAGVDGNGLRTKGEADDSPSARRMSDSESIGSLAPDIGTTQSGDRAPAGPSESAPMPAGGLSIAHNRIEPTDSLDFFPTPPWATRALMERVLVHLNRHRPCSLQTAKDPACGEGHMSEVLKEYFLKVIATDIKDYGRHCDAVADFLDPTDNPEYDAEWIITNPPFGDNTDKFILKALQQASYGVAMLVRLQCLETVGRYERIYRDVPPSLIAFFAERVPMHKGRWLPDGDTMTAYIWLVWIKGMSPQPPFWIPPGCRAALTKPDDAARFGAQIEIEAPASEAAE